MAWEEELFSVLDDLEQQAVAAYDAERDAELADRSRAEYAGVSLLGRLHASVGRELAVTLRGRGPAPLTGTLQRVGEGWFLLRAPGQDWVVPSPAVLSVRGSSERAVAEVARSPLARLGLGSALRRIAETGRPCVVHLVDGTRREAVLARVGRDFVESSEGVLLVFDGIAAVQSRD